MQANVEGHRSTTYAAQRPPAVVSPSGPTSYVKPWWIPKNAGLRQAAWPHFAANPPACQPANCGGAHRCRRFAQVRRQPLWERQKAVPGKEMALERDFQRQKCR